jgi:Ca2+-binding RTX toxin-like protein
VAAGKNCPTPDTRQAGNDTLIDGGGPDDLRGGAGSDTCQGGSGTDTATRCENSTGIP